MSVNTGPYIVLSGLVFDYDMNNPRSYIGPPITNSYWNNGSPFDPWTVSGTNTDVTGTSNQGPVSNAKTWKFNKSGTSNQWNGWEGSYGGIWTGSAGDVWATSYWYKTTAPAGNTGFGVGYFYTSDWSRAYNCTVLANQNSIIADGNWHWNYTVTQFNEAYTNAIIVDGPSWGYSTSAGELYLNGLQWNKNNYAGTYVAGTRSATQSIIDLTNNNTVTINSLVYSNNNTFTFNPGVNYLTISNLDSLVSDVTLESVVNLGTASGPHQTAICTDLNYRYGIKLMASYHGPIAAWVGFGTTDYLLSGSSIQNAGNVYIAATRSSSTGLVSLYMNGALVTSATSNTGNISSAGSGQGRIGLEYHSGSYGFNGNIYKATAYNKVLSASEIAQNFNALRGAYGI